MMKNTLTSCPYTNTFGTCLFSNKSTDFGFKRLKKLLYLNGQNSDEIVLLAATLSDRDGISSKLLHVTKDNYKNSPNGGMFIVV